MMSRNNRSDARWTNKELALSYAGALCPEVRSYVQSPGFHTRTGSEAVLPREKAAEEATASAQV